MKSLFNRAASKLKTTNLGNTKRSRRTSDLPLFLTEQQKSTSPELANSVNQLQNLKGVVKRLTLDVNNFSKQMEDLCIQQVLLADGFGRIFTNAPSSMLQESTEYTTACSLLANTVRANCERKLSATVRNQLEKKIQIIHKLNQRIIKWQENHLIFSDTLNTARANARKNNATELSNNDVSKIRLAEGTLESHARTLVLEINEIHTTRFEWIRNIVMAFRAVQSIFYTQAGSTLAMSLTEENNGTGSTATTTATDNSSSNVSLPPRQIFQYLDFSDIIRFASCCSSEVAVVWCWYVQDHSQSLSWSRLAALVQCRFVRTHVAASCHLVPRFVSWNAIVEKWKTKGLISKNDIDPLPTNVKTSIASIPSIDRNRCLTSISLSPIQCASWYPKLLQQANTYENTKRQEQQNQQNQHNEHNERNEEDENDLVLSYFSCIEGDIGRTSGRKKYGKSKRGGRLKGYTVGYTGDDSAASLESLVASALGQTEKERALSVASCDSTLEVKDGNEGQEEDKEGEGKTKKAIDFELKLCQQRLRNVLRTFVFTEKMYGQGLSFIVAAMLERYRCNETEEQDEEELESRTFGMLLALVNTYGFRDVKILPRCFFQLNELVQQHFPVLNAHLKECNVSCSVYASSWFLTLFQQHTVPQEYALVVLDIFFMKGWTTIFQVCLLIMDSLQDTLLGSDFERIQKVLRNSEKVLQNQYPTIELFVAGIDAYEVTNDALRDLEKKYMASC